jgi:hypothetical protein
MYQIECSITIPCKFLNFIESQQKTTPKTKNFTHQEAILTKRLQGQNMSKLYIFSIAIVREIQSIQSTKR